MAHQVGVVGASGYSGAELLRLLAGHPAMEVAVVGAQRHVGERVNQLHPNLDSDLVFEDAGVEALAQLDLVFLATPHTTAMELGAALHAAGVPVVDLSAAYRLDAEAFEDWYREPHEHPGLLPGVHRDDDSAAVFGLTEWNRAAVRGARIVANPGCYPTAALLGLLPLAALVEPDSIVIDAKSGTSGAGRGLRDDLHHTNVHADLAAYGAPRHRHTVEIERWLHRFAGADLGPVSFTPHLVPMARGLLATCYARLRDGITATDVEEALTSRYAAERFIRVLPAGTFPHTKSLTGSNACHVSAVVDPRTRRVLVTSAIDNLGKGAAGQALQNANLVLGLEEDLGLTTLGVYP